MPTKQRGRLDFSEYLGVKVDDIEVAVPPLGHYYAKVKTWKSEEIDYNQGDGGRPHVTVYFELTSEGSDVEPSDLPPKGIRGTLVRKSYQLDDPQGLKSLRVATEAVVGESTAKGHKLEDALNMLPNMDCILYMDQRPGKGEREGEFFPVVKKVLPADAEIG